MILTPANERPVTGKLNFRAPESAWGKSDSGAFFQTDLRTLAEVATQTKMGVALGFIFKKPKGESR